MKYVHSLPMKDAAVKQRIKQLEERVAELRREVEFLRNAVLTRPSPPVVVKPSTLPVIPQPITPWRGPGAPYAPPYAPVSTTTGCSVCGLRFDGPMGYVCTRSDCPSGVRCTTSSTSVSISNPKGSDGESGHMAVTA